MINMDTTYYYTMLQQLLLHCYFHFFYINCWLILTSWCKTCRKMLVFDRPSIFLLILVFSILQSTIQPPPFHLIQLHKCLVAGPNTRGYTRYSPALFSPFIVLPDRQLQSTLEPRSRRSHQEPTTTSSSPLTKSSLEVPRQEAS